MNTALKHRLVGTIIVVALLVIFLPDYLDGQKQTREDIQVSIPKVPDALTITPPKSKPIVETTTAIDEVEQIGDSVSRPNTAVGSNNQVTELPVNVKSEQRGSSQSVEAEELVTVATAQSEALNDNATQLNETDLVNQTVKLTTADDDAIGWVVQLGSFKHQKNVNSLLKKLDDAGYRAFTRPINTSAGRLTKVFIGPDIERDALENKLGHLKEITGLNGRITPFKAN